jgi:hypothetical protein
MKKLFEEYVESADYKIAVFFKELQGQIQRWFTEGSLAAQGCEIDGDIQISNYNPMEKFLICNFVEPVTEGDEEEGSSYRYRMIFMVRLDQMKGDEAQNGQLQGTQAQGGGMPIETPAEGKALEINKVLLKIHQFDEENKEKGELVEEVDVDDIKEDFIIDKIGQLKDKSDDKGTDKNDLKDNIYTK